jgi:hypothetical protein
MSRSTTGDENWDRMTEVEKTEVVRQGSATPGPLALTTPSTYRHISNPSSPGKKTKKKRVKPTERYPATKTHTQRFGLPEDFVPRMQRSGRSVLLEDNVYRLPNGQEFIPCHPTGTLGKSRHLYSLLTPSQHEQRRRGSVYIRMDGRIFDYSVDDADLDREIFDTGYTIYDLERTGQYAQFASQDYKRQRARPAKRKTNSATAGGGKA